MSESENKPLTKEERERIRSLIGEGGRHDDHFDDSDVEALLSAEAYWREAVKNAGEWVEDHRDFDGHCFFCKAGIHAPDCPWKVAQDE